MRYCDIHTFFHCIHTVSMRLPSLLAFLVLLVPNLITLTASAPGTRERYGPLQDIESSVILKARWEQGHTGTTTMAGSTSDMSAVTTATTGNSTTTAEATASSTSTSLNATHTSSSECSFSECWGNTAYAKTEKMGRIENLPGRMNSRSNRRLRPRWELVGLS